MGRPPGDPVTRRLWITLSVLLILLLGVGALIAVLEGAVVGLESPKYRVVEKLAEVEIREYEPYLVAETEVEGTLEDAGSRGFRILAKFIFGANRSEKKVAMTAPVTQEKASEKIAMTTPVAQERTGDRFTIQFMMPSKYDEESLPVPDDPRIRIREIPATRLAAIRYSGTWSRKRYETHLAELRDTLRNNGYASVGEPIWARYDPPFKPWFLRRNEILTRFQPASGAPHSRL